MENEYKEMAALVKSINKKLLKCEKNLETLPKGTIYKRKINNKYYVYRNQKINGKVFSQYLGVDGDPFVKQEIKKSKLYKNNKLNVKALKKQLDKMCKEINKKEKRTAENVSFAININKVDGLEPSNKAKALLNLLENGVIDLETYEFAIDRMYANV